MQAIYIEQTGGREVLQCGDRPEPQRSGDSILVGVEYAGVNFIDTYHRTGLYPLTLPAILGLEGVGRIIEVGPKETEFQPGQLVAWAQNIGSYAEHVVVPRDKLVVVPEVVPSEVACALMIQGLTAQYLSALTYSLKPGDTCLVHAGAGGVGLLLVQLAKARGARVITTVSTEQKAELVRSLGIEHIIVYSKEDFLKRVKEITEERGVEVVYDSVGQATFEGSLSCLARRGMFVSYGNSSGPVPAFEPLRLSRGGSLYLTRPSLFDYIPDAQSLRKLARELFAAYSQGLVVKIGAVFPLSSAAHAHRALESRETVGKVLLTV